jgi:hypothetical protein
VDKRRDNDPIAAAKKCIPSEPADALCHPPSHRFTPRHITHITLHTTPHHTTPHHTTPHHTTPHHTTPHHTTPHHQHTTPHHTTSHHTTSRHTHRLFLTGPNRESSRGRDGAADGQRVWPVRAHRDHGQPSLCRNTLRARRRNYSRRQAAHLQVRVIPCFICLFVSLFVCCSCTAIYCDALRQTYSPSTHCVLFTTLFECPALATCPTTPATTRSGAKADALLEALLGVSFYTTPSQHALLTYSNDHSTTA